MGVGARTYANMGRLTRQQRKRCYKWKEDRGAVRESALPTGQAECECGTYNQHERESVTNTTEPDQGGADGTPWDLRGRISRGGAALAPSDVPRPDGVLNPMSKTRA